MTHELGHALGYDDLDPQQYPDHIMAGLLQPRVNRLAMEHDLPLPNDWRFGAEDAAVVSSLFSVWRLPGDSPGEGELLRQDRSDRIRSAAAGAHGLLSAAVDRVLDEMLRDDLRISKDGWSGREEHDLDELQRPRRDEFHQEVDEVFAHL